MTYSYQWFGAMTACAFLFGCMIALGSPTTYLPTPTAATSWVDDPDAGAAP